jgi:MFS family permease
VFAKSRPSGSPSLPLALLCVAQFVVVLDVTIVAVALPAIRDDLLAFGGLLVSAGRAADLLGRRRVFVTGLAVFAAAVRGLRSRALAGGARHAARPAGSRSSNRSESSAARRRRSGSRACRSTSP